MKTLLAATLCFLSACLPVFSQTQVGYWDLNGTLTRSAGSSGTLSAELLVLGSGFINYGTGTAVNLQPGFTAGSSLRYFNLVSVVEVGRLTLTGLDFSGLETPTVTFAIRSNPAFTLSDTFQLEYNINGGSWLSATGLALPTTSFSLFSYTFGAGVLDNVGNAGIRVAFSSVATILDTVEIDNVRVTAVPEPGTLGLLAVVGIALIALKRRRRAPRSE